MTPTDVRAAIVSELIHKHDCKSYCEVGVKQGRMFVRVLDHCPGILGYAVDPFVPYAEGNDWDFDSIKAEFIGNIEMYDMKSRAIHIELPSLQAVEKFRVKGPDLVFIDAAHDYANVFQDILAWGFKANKVLAGHDFNKDKFPGVVKAVNQLVPDRMLAGEDIWWTKINK